MRVCVRPPRTDLFFKLLVVGESGVGKTCLLLRFVVRSTHTPLLLCTTHTRTHSPYFPFPLFTPKDNEFSETHMPSIGVDFVRLSTLSCPHDTLLFSRARTSPPHRK